MEKKGMLDQLPSRTSFWVGFLTASGLFFAFGFFIMLSLVLWTNVKGDSAVADTTDAVAAANTNVAPTPTTADAGDTVPAAAGSVNLASIEENHIRGNGEITIVEFSDADCPFCQRFHPTMKQVMTEYDGKVRWAYQHFPLTSLHPNAEKDAVAMECGAEQGKFWEVADLLYEADTADVPYNELASKAGINEQQFTDCINADKYLDKVNAQALEAQNLGGQGTPFSLIVDKDGKVLETIPGALPYASVKQALDSYVQ